LRSNFEEKDLKMAMRLTKKITLSTLAFSGIFIFCSLSPADVQNGSAAPAARTGSPGDGASCTACHGGTAATVAGAITSDIPASGYVPGTVYTITANISDPVKNKFGFQISPQKVSGAQVGTMQVSDATRTQLVGTGKYITHKTAGTTGTNNANTWSFQWTAPAAGTGAFTFYGAFLLANANNASSGDAVKLSTLAVSEDISTSVSEKDLNTFHLYPNPAKDFICADINSNSETIVKIWSVKGELVKAFSFEKGNTIKADIKELAAGIYILQAEQNGKQVTRKFIKE
jgi:hypothetical protein